MAVMDRIKDERMKHFGLRVYREIHDKFQPDNTHIEIGFLYPMVLCVRNVQAPFTGFGAEFITSPPAPITAVFPKITSNTDGSLNIEIKYEIRPATPPRARSMSPPRRRSPSPPPRRRSPPPVSPPRRSKSRQKSVARPAPQRPRPQRVARRGSSSSSDNEEKKSTFFGFW